jgi:methionyl-tRNA formyltransferase
MRIAILAPIQNSLYSRMVVYYLSREKEVEVVGIVVRTPWNLKRVRSEFKRDGVRLINKIFDKWLFPHQKYVRVENDNLSELAHREGLPGKTLQDLAELLEIPIISVGDLNQKKSLEFLQKINPDLIVFTGGGIIRKQVLEISQMGVLNCHTGWLPRYRGMDVIEWSVLEAENKSPQVGISLHFMDQGVDTGPILLQEQVPLKFDDTFEQIRLRIEPMMVNLILMGVRGLQEDNLKAEPQKLEEGYQYYVTHPRLKNFAARKLTQFTNDHNK